MNTYWPKHKPETTLHHIVMDGVAKDFLDAQIIAETNGLADSEMITFYRAAFFRDMMDFFKERNERTN